MQPRATRMHPRATHMHPRATRQVVVGTLPNGTVIDAATVGAVSFGPPPLPSAWYGSSRWLQYYLRLQHEARKPAARQSRPLFSAMTQWHCRRQHARGPSVGRVQLVFVRELTPPPDALPRRPERFEVWSEDCAHGEWV